MAGEVEGWAEYRKLVLSELERLRDDLVVSDKKFDLFRNDEVSRIKVELALLKQELKFRAGLWGAVAGLIPALATMLYLLLSIPHLRQ